MTTITLNKIKLSGLALILLFIFGGLVASVPETQAQSVGNTIKLTCNTNIRTGPGTSFGIIGSGAAPTGTTFVVLGGPQSANGFNWYRVNYQGNSQAWVSNVCPLTIVSGGGSTPAPTVSVSVNPSSINLGQSFTFTWSSSNATSCVGSRGGQLSGTSGSMQITPSSAGTYTAGAQCSGAGGTSSMQTRDVSVTQQVSTPTVSVSVNPSSINLGQSFTFTWSSSNATSCVGSRGGQLSGTSGSMQITPSSAGTYTAGAQCSGAGGTSSMQTRDVSVTSQSTPAPVVGFSGTATINVGQSTNLGWATDNATSCIASASPADSNWTGSVATNGSKSVSPAQTTTYTLSCSGAGGSGSKSVTVTVNGAPPVGPGCESPVASGQANVSKNMGDSFTVNWKAGNVVSNPNYPNPSCRLFENGVSQGDVSCTGSRSFTKSSPGTYNYNVLVEPYNIISNQASVTVQDNSVPPPPPPPTPACNDGLDNDGDGSVDMNDPGCSAPSDNDEFNAPPVAAPNIISFEPVNSALDPLISRFEALNGESISGGTCDLTATPPSVVLPTRTSTLNWSCSRVVSGCTITDNDPVTTDIGLVASSGSQATPSLRQTTEFTLSCPGLSGDTATVRFFNAFIKEVSPQ